MKKDKESNLIVPDQTAPQDDLGLFCLHLLFLSEYFGCGIFSSSELFMEFWLFLVEKGEYKQQSF